MRRPEKRRERNGFRRRHLSLTLRPYGTIINMLRMYGAYENGSPLIPGGMRAAAVKARQMKKKKAIGVENFVFLACFVAFFAAFGWKMGLMNMINTMINTAYSLLIETVFYLMAMCVIMGAVSSLFTEFGIISLFNRLLYPLMRPVYDLPGAASVGIITTFLSDNPAVLTLADDKYFRSFFKRYQFPAITNLATAFGMGMIVCTYMLGLSGLGGGEHFGKAVLIGLLGAVIGSIVSTRLMIAFSAKQFGKDAWMPEHEEGVDQKKEQARPIRAGNVANRFLSAILDGGKSGVKMGFEIIPGVLLICTLVLMMTNGMPEGGYTGAAYEGVALLPMLAGKVDFILKPLFGFSSPEAIGVPITALGAAGASLTMARQLVVTHLAGANDIAVFTAMCMCWSGYLSTHVSMMSTIGCTEMTGKALVSHTVGGLVAGITAHWLFVLVSLIL